MLPIAGPRTLGPERRAAASLAVSAVAGCALLAAVDPHDGGPYPTCPTRALLGIDCPACGTLRGVHSLLHGRVGEALSHNLLLAVAVPVAAVVWWSWIWAAAGRPLAARPLPAWVMPAVVCVAVAFTVVRNVAPPALGWLDSA